MTVPDVTALIATVLNDVRTPDDPEGAARAVQDALIAAGVLDVREERQIARRVLDGEAVRSLLQHFVEQQMVGERSRWELVGYNRGRMEVLDEVGWLTALAGDLAGALDKALRGEEPEACARILERARKALG